MLHIKRSLKTVNQIHLNYDRLPSEYSDINPNLLQSLLIAVNLWHLTWENISISEEMQYLPEWSQSPLLSSSGCSEI